MTQINPLTGSIIQSAGAQPAQKARQIRRVQNLRKNSALQGEELEHQVESADTVGGAGDGRDSYQPRRDPKRQEHALEEPPEDEAGHIDLTA